MEEFLLYIGKAALALGAFFLAYLALFQHQKQFLFNRIYLPVSFFISFLIPLVTFTKVNYIKEIPAAAANSFAYLPETTTASETQFIFEWYHYLLAIYALGIIVFFLNLLIGHLKAINIIRFSRLKELFGAQVNLTKKDVHPFSFFSRIVLSEKTLKNPNLKMIVDHEMIHVRERHTLDILVAELLFLLQWFNPFAWLIRDAMRNNLEYLTDHQVAQNHNAEAYQLAMVGLAHKKGVAPFLTALNGSQLKNRIIMMKKKTENRYGLLKQLVVLPLLAILIMGLSNKEVRTEVLHDAGQLKVVVDGVELPVDHPDLMKLDFTNGFNGGEIIEALGLEDKVVANAMSFDKNPNEDGVYCIQTSDYEVGTVPEFDKMLGKPVVLVRSGNFSVKGTVENAWGEVIPNAKIVNNESSEEFVADGNGNFELAFNGIEKPVVLSFSAPGYYKNDVVYYGNKKELSIALAENDSEKEFTVTGKITNEDGDGIPAAMVLVKGTTVGTVSDFSGDYKIETDETNTLVFKMIGYAEKEVAIDGKSKLDIQLKSNGHKTPVVGVPFPNQDLSTMDLFGNAKNPPLYIVDDNEPLYIVDGVPVTDINSIPPEKIESVSVLKGEQATALYGSVGGKNGVVVVTTKDATAKNSANVKLIGLGEQTSKSFSNVQIEKLGFETTTGEAPLYFVDGKEMGNIANISAEDIESISVLKDESATALYGEKGKNGVIVISTKAAAKAKMDDAIVIVEGVPYNGDINDIDPSTIESMEVLKDESATSIYGPIAKNGAISIKLKGSADLNGKSPLIFLDGEKYTGDMGDIDPENIQSIDVLKDASAIKTYGDEGKDGVILITSKTEEITSELDLRKFIAKRMKYPTELREANITGESNMFVKVNKHGTVVSVKETGSKNAIPVDEVVAVGYKPKEVSGTTVEDAQEKLDRAAKSLLLQLPTINIPEYKGETLVFTLKYVLQEK
ncbi:TonB-dependent receptor plug domain-containing protein [uncultured Draconibacterium sp.]|uniref:TonB-dependent receptor plug domain-containing protein n=1 Tax=uncultured Draconibacterium sp. TaxID=1573823 RepID=UPI0029C86973|nr:TonB-dependent receptor plug domain-containing protein [uncultured Draconibacterium sp.]